MRRGQKLIASDGYEVALFPLEYMYISQGEGGAGSHYNTYNIDFLGWDSVGRLFQCPVYAPCTMQVVHTWLNEAGGNAVFFQSTRKVHLANGQLDYLTIVFGHDSNPPYHIIGAIVQQGDLCYHTGNYGEYTTGDHVHSCCGQGIYQGTTERVGGHSDLTNRIHYWEAVYINDTFLIEDYNYNWLEYTLPIKEKKRDNFPWVLYARKLRNNR